MTPLSKLDRLTRQTTPNSNQWAKARLDKRQVASTEILTLLPITNKPQTHFNWWQGATSIVLYRVQLQVIYEEARPTTRSINADYSLVKRFGSLVQIPKKTKIKAKIPTWYMEIGIHIQIYTKHRIKAGEEIKVPSFSFSPFPNNNPINHVTNI